MKRAIGYIRVSTAGQGESGIGLDLQRRQIEAYAAATGFRVSKIYAEVASAAAPAGRHNRPVLRSAILDALETKQPIFLASVDRLARCEATAQRFRARGGVTFHCADDGIALDTPALVARAARGQREAELISERTKRRLSELKASGRRLGNATNLEHAQRMGAAANKMLGEQRLREFEEAVQAARSDGARTDSEIAANLNRAGHPTARGGAWTRVNVARLLKKAKAASQDVAADSEPSEEIADAPFHAGDGYISAGGKKRIESFMEAKGLKMGQLMCLIGGKALDASLGGALRSTRVAPMKITKVEALVRAFEAELVDPRKRVVAARADDRNGRDARYGV